MPHMAKPAEIGAINLRKICGEYTDASAPAASPIGDGVRDCALERLRRGPQRLGHRTTEEAPLNLCRDLQTSWRRTLAGRYCLSCRSIQSATGVPRRSDTNASLIVGLLRRVKCTPSSVEPSYR